MKRIMSILIGIAVTLSSLVAFATPSEAASQKWCDPASRTSGGECISVKSYTAKKVEVVESVPLANNSSKTATFTCQFSKTISKEFTTTVSLSAKLKAAAFGIAEVEVGTGLEMSMKQTSTQATAASVSVKLAPHEMVTCQRTYGYYSVTYTREEWGSNHVIHTSTFTATIPHDFGIRLAG